MPDDRAASAGTMGSVRHFDLCIIGSGSGNSIVDQRFADRKVALVDQGTFGGTCLNVGCIPSKMYVYPASLAQAPRVRAPAGRRSRPDRGALDGDPGPDLRPDRCDVRKRQGLSREERERHAVHRTEPIRGRPNPAYRFRPHHHRGSLRAGGGQPSGGPRTAGTVRGDVPHLRHRDAAAPAARVHDHHGRWVRRRRVRPRVLRLRHRGHRGQSGRT